MKKLHFRRLAKVIALSLSILMIWQGVVWANPDVFQKNSLQPYTLFTSPDPEDGFFNLVTGYLGFYLTGLENDPRNRNVIRMKKMVDSALKEVKLSKGISDEFKDTIPNEAEFHSPKAAVIIDLGLYKVRYFNHNIPETEIPGIEDPGDSYEVLQTRVGQYLSRQILTRKALTSSSDGQDALTEAPAEPGSFDPGTSKTADTEPEAVKDAKGDSSKSPEALEELEKISEKKWQRAIDWYKIYIHCYILALLGFFSGFLPESLINSQPPEMAVAILLTSSVTGFISWMLFMWAVYYHHWWDGLPLQSLVVTGPYRYLRHPYCLTLIMIPVAISMGIYTLFDPMLAIPWFVFNGFIIRLFDSFARAEEEELTARFGEEYRRVLRRTYRWLPRLFPSARPGSGPSA
ncbi:MAG: isoprenylcysteine carboxylmethyltransferase family protein, partial [Candidatus Omnitrophota bacterium]|nr:isoprenylcysteine carboxylmethyltransferase family protein [Candidatus Omnitrophota bacterium]